MNAYIYMLSNPLLVFLETSSLSDGGRSLEKVVSGGDTSVSVGGLVPASPYTFTLSAHNAMGASRPSQVGPLKHSLRHNNSMFLPEEFRNKPEKFVPFTITPFIA